MPVEAERLAVEEVLRRLQVLVTEGRHQGITVHPLVGDGPAAAQILKAADENDADMVLLAIESKGILERALLGTTAEQVVREATVPVLSVPVQVVPQRQNAEPALTNP